jgi:Fe2+ or Zn2+ uptake regulation protein
MSYYNTTNEKGIKLKESHRKAKTQEEVIYSFFLMHGKPLSPSQVLKKLNLECPITSIRRALTNLTNEGKIIKTGVKTVGLYNKKEHLWRLRTAQDDIDPDQYKLF